MSARDDYPIGRVPAAYTVEPGVWHDLCDELDRLRPLAAAAVEAVRAWLTPHDDQDVANVRFTEAMNALARTVPL